jgi:hypothetical protein
VHVRQFSLEPLEPPVAAVVEHDGQDDRAQEDYDEDAYQRTAVVAAASSDRPGRDGRAARPAAATRRGQIALGAVESGPADAAEGGVADKVVVSALAGAVAVLAPVSLGAEFLASGSRVSGSALAAAVDRVAGGVVVAVALVRAIRTEGA